MHRIDADFQDHRHQYRNQDTDRGYGLKEAANKQQQNIGEQEDDSIGECELGMCARKRFGEGAQPATHGVDLSAHG